MRSRHARAGERPLGLDWHEILMLAVCIVVLAWQLFLPGFIGLADNRDFAKVAGRLCLGLTGWPYRLLRALSSRPSNGKRSAIAGRAECPHRSWRSRGRPPRWSSAPKEILRISIFAGLGAIHALCFLSGWYLLLLANAGQLGGRGVVDRDCGEVCGYFADVRVLCPI